MAESKFDKSISWDSLNQLDMTTEVGGLVEHLFRREAGRLISSLARRLGAGHIDLAEESVQDALVKALKTWPYQGVPASPAGWLATAARNIAIDRLRRQSVEASALDALASSNIAFVETLDEPAMEDRLAMMFAGCHPALPVEAQIALTLKSVCGFTTDEIARAFMADERTVAQRIVRAKRRLLEVQVSIAVPPIAELPARLDAVLQVLYLTFNEGYSALSGDELVRRELCEEALRLGRMLAQHPSIALPKVHALVALMFFHASRLPARVDGAGELLRLADQDRGQWDQRLIMAGLRHLEASADGQEMSRYHVEAGIAAIHAQAPCDNATDWPKVLWLYNLLLSLSPTPIVRLNRAVAIMRVQGQADALVELDQLTSLLNRYYLLHSVRAECLRQAGQIPQARMAYESALRCPCCEPEKRFLRKRMMELNDEEDLHR